MMFHLRQGLGKTNGNHQLRRSFLGQGARWAEKLKRVDALRSPGDVLDLIFYEVMLVP